MNLALQEHQKNLKKCALCHDMVGSPVHGQAVLSNIMLIGQAPGIKEADLDKPFAWTAGKTLFQWFTTLGVDETTFREGVYMSAICRCYPGKSINKKGKIGGDRVPSKQQIKNCSQWLNAEINLLKPQLIILVGKLAINQFFPVSKLTDIIGTSLSRDIGKHHCDFIALPHPSGASTWFRMEPGKTLLQQALQKLSQHSAWQKTF